MLETLYEIGGDHEIALRDHFGDAVFFRGSRLFDKPLYVLAFSNRSGSNLLGEYLRATPGLAGFHEELNHFDLIPEAAQRGFQSLSEYVADKCARALPEAYGFKANWEQLAMVYKFGVDRMFDGTHIIHVVREDVVGQAVSFSIASQKRIWRSTDVGPARPPTFDYDAIARYLRVALADTQMIQLVATLSGAPYQRVIYEEVVKNPVSALSRCLHFAGITSLPPETFRPQYERQATEINREFRERFLSIARTRTLFPAISTDEAASA